MSRQAGKVAWSADEKIRLLDYIRDRKAKNKKASAVDFVKTVVGRLDEAQAARATLKIVQEEVTAIVKNTKLDKKHTSVNLWKSGPKILNLNHPYLRGVYSSELITEISGTTQAGSMDGRKRKPEDSVDDQRGRKRSRQETPSEALGSESSGQEDVVKKTTTTKRTPPRQRNKRKPEEVIDDQRKTKRTRHTSILETTVSGTSRHEDTAKESVVSAKTALPKQRNKRDREEDSFSTTTRSTKKQKVGMNAGTLMRADEESGESSTSEIQPEGSSQTDDQSEAEGPRTANRLRVTLKLKQPEVPESSQHENVSENEEDDLAQTEHSFVMHKATKNDGRSGTSTANTDTSVRALPEPKGGHITKTAAAATSANVQHQPLASGRTEYDSISPEPSDTAGQKDPGVPLEIPRDYRQFGLRVSPPHHGNIPEDLHAVYLHIMTAVHEHLGELNIDIEQPVLIKDRAWDDDLAQLMGTVFGHETTAEDLAKEFATIQGARVLPLHIFLRSLCVAAVMEWAFRPLPLGFRNDSNSRDAQTVNAIRQVLTNRFNEGVMRQIFFEATQYAIQKEIMGEIKVRAGIFAHRLFMALSPLFQSNQINHWSHVNDPLYLRPLTEAHKDFNPNAGMKQPATRDIQSYPESDANRKPLPGSTDFERNLKVAFEKALQTRYKWDEQDDGEYSYDFPIFKENFQQGYNFNEEFVLEKSTTERLVSTDRKNRVFVATMFGVHARSRKPWTADFTKFEIMSRPSVFNLD